MRCRNPRFGQAYGFILLEILLSILLFTSAFVVTIELFLAFAGRITNLARAQRHTHGPQHVLSTFTGVSNLATHWGVYPDRAAFEQYPLLAGTTGNFAVLWKKDGTTVAFELINRELRILENPGTAATKERLWARDVDAPDYLCTLQNGAIALRFKTHIGNVQTTFHTSARVAASR
jgi:type II secretory pathway pseudopilin PulG